MPNYEELYFIARNKYHRAVEDRNVICRNMAEWHSRKTVLIQELEQNQSTLTGIRNKKMLFQDAINKCRDILNNEFSSMKRNIQDTSIEYKKIFTSDRGVADIQAIYSSDISDTQNNLDAVCSELDRKIRGLEIQEMDADRAVAGCRSELNQVINNLNHADSAKAVVQHQINNYYAEMKEYEIRWQYGN